MKRTLTLLILLTILIAFPISTASAAEPATGGPTRVSIVANPSAPAGMWTDEFDGPTLDSRWYWMNEDPTHWSLTAQPGFMRIIAQEGFKNYLLQAAPTGDYVIETRVLFEPTQNIQRAELVLVQGGDTGLGLMRAYCDFGPPGCPGNAIYFDYVQDGTPAGSNFATVTPYTGEAHLRIVKHGQQYTGYVSDDNIHWTLVGAHLTSADFAPTGVGLATLNSLGASEIPADFDYFTLVEFSERVMLPFIAR